jgi:hypothetical protein
LIAVFVRLLALERQGVAFDLEGIHLLLLKQVINVAVGVWLSGSGRGGTHDPEGQSQDEQDEQEEGNIILAILQTGHSFGLIDYPP